MREEWKVPCALLFYKYRDRLENAFNEDGFCLPPP